MKKSEEHETITINIKLEDRMLISNQSGKTLLHSEYIRNNMVKLNTDSEPGLNITQIGQYSNSNSIASNYVRKKMIFGWFLYDKV